MDHEVTRRILAVFVAVDRTRRGGGLKEPAADLGDQGFVDLVSAVYDVGHGVGLPAELEKFDDGVKSGVALAESLQGKVTVGQLDDRVVEVAEDGVILIDSQTVAEKPSFESCMLVNLAEVRQDFEGVSNDDV